MIKTATIYKQIGKTPLEALEIFRRKMIVEDPDNKDVWKNTPMTYAGRLDPMAEGLLLVLVGDECKNKEKYLGLDKEYEVEIVFGISTDSYDALGLAEATKNLGALDNLALPDLAKYVGKFTQPYPPFSSKTISGKQLHELSRESNLPNRMPTKEVEIYSIGYIGDKHFNQKEIGQIKLTDLVTCIQKMINLVHGDFRQKDILERWSQISNLDELPVIKIRVNCSSGTYMRSLAHKIGQDLGVSAFALSIKRTAISIH